MFSVQCSPFTHKYRAHAKAYNIGSIRPKYYLNQNLFQINHLAAFVRDCLKWHTVAEQLSGNSKQQKPSKENFNNDELADYYSRIQALIKQLILVYLCESGEDAWQRILQHFKRTPRQTNRVHKSKR